MKLKEVAKLPEMAMIDGIVFIEVVEWRRILFLMIAYKNDLCKIYTATPSMRITERQKITNVGAKDGEFFTHGNDLYLVVVSSKPEHHDVPSTIYRWTGTHFDIVQMFMTSGAVAVSTFYFKGTVIIIVAQYPYDKPAIGSQVFRWSHNKLERMQFLPTNGPVALQYMEAYGESYLLVINDYEFSSLYWWTGREFIIWDNFYDVKGMSKISIGYMEEETLILIALKDKIQVYRLLESRLHRLTTVSLFDGEEILSMSLHPDENMKLVAISRKNGALSTSVFNLQLLKGPFGDNQQKMDPLLQCLLSLNARLLSRDSVVKNLALKMKKMLSVKSNVSLKGKLVVKGLITIKKAVIKSVKNVGYMNLSTSALQIFDQLKTNGELITETKNSISQLVMKSVPGHISGKIHLYQNLFLDSSSMKDLIVNNLGGKVIDLPNMLRYSSDQDISGVISLNTLKATKMSCNELNGIYLEDLLLNYGDQHVSGYHKVQGITVNNLQIEENVMINDVKLKSLATRDRRIVGGKKEFHTLEASNLKMTFFCDVNVASFKDGLVFKEGGDYFLKGLKFHSKLIVESLNVTELNEIQWDGFQEAVFLKGKNQLIDGTVLFNATLSVKNAYADYINKISPSELMTCSTEQVITTTVSVKLLKAKDIITSLCNGLDLAADIARIGQDNYVNGFVQMADVQVFNVTTDRHAAWVGIPKPSDMKHSLVYEGSVAIEGNLLVNGLEILSGGIQINGSHIDILQLGEEFLMVNAEEIPALQASNKLNIYGNLFTRKINGINVTDLVHIDSTVELSGIHFADVTTMHFGIEPSVTVSGVNVEQLFGSTVMIQGDFLVKGSKNFRSGMFVEKLTSEWIDDHDMTFMVPLTEPVLNLGSKTFNTINIEGDITAGKVGKINYVNNLHLSSVFSHAARIDSPLKMNSAKLSTIRGDNIQVSTLNKMDFNSFVKSLDPKSSVIHIKKVVINGDVAFSGPLEVEMLNYLDICSYFNDVVNKNVGGNVNGHKTFVGSISVKDTLKTKFLNKVDVISLEKNYFSKTKPQVVEGHFEVKYISLNDLEAMVLNGKQTNVFFISGTTPQLMAGNVQLLDVHVDGDLEVSVLNSCDLIEVLENINGDVEIEHFKLLNVTEQIIWAENSLLERSLSNLLTKAVDKKSVKPVIDGNVTFFDNTYTTYMITKGGVNGVDLKFTAGDCVKKSDGIQVLHGQKIFLSTINTSKVEVINNANVKWINDINIPFVNKTLVRKMGFFDIAGHKTFLNGFDARKLQCLGKVSGTTISNIVSVDADILPRVEVQNLQVLEDLNCLMVNSMNLSQFLLERITCDSLQEVDMSLAFNGNLIFQGETKTSLINNLDVQHVLLLDSDRIQNITGRKTFLQEIIIEGDIDVGFLNGFNLSEEYSNGLVGNDDVEIDGNVVFSSGTIINSNLEVNYFINGIELSAVYNNALAVFEKNMKNEESYLSKIQRIVYDSFELCDATTDELMYLDYEQKEYYQANSSTHSLHLTRGEVVTINVMDQDTCSLPKPCFCLRQVKIRLIDGLFTLMPSNGHQRHFMVHDEIGERGAELYSSTISRDNVCRQSGENLRNEYNKLVWMMKDGETGDLTSDSNMDVFTFEGYVTDVHSFTVESDLYVVIMIYYDAIKSSHNINSLVLQWRDGETESRVVQKIPTYGAMVSKIIFINEEIYLFIGNTLDSDLRTRDVNDEIYKFDVRKEQFLLLRSIPTTGTNSAASLSMQGHTFLIKSQDFNVPAAVYKYSEEYDNFYFYQNLYVRGSTLGVAVFYIGGGSKKDGYVAVASTNDRIHLFKYNHIEGFKPVWDQRQTGIRSLKSFKGVKDEFLAIATLLDISVLRIVVQGS